MLTELENGIVQIEPSDWRWGASIVGVSKYFDYHKLDYKIEDEYIEFDEKLIDKERYLKFVEYFFSDRMHHIEVLNLLDSNNFDSENIKKINEKLSANSIMQQNFGHHKEKSKNKIEKLIFDETKVNQVKRILNDSNCRMEIIENTYREGDALYKNFCNKGNLFDKNGIVCRLNGYYVDNDRKLGALSFRDQKQYIEKTTTDSIYFDFIPFGFSKTREAFFINNNFTINQLIATNKTDLMIDEEVKVSNLLYRVKESSNFIDYDVEVIKKERNNDYYETIFVRKNAIKIFKNLNGDILEVLKRPCNGKKTEKGENLWVDVEKIVTNSILNNIKLDSLIEGLFKAYNNNRFLILNLIRVNQLIYGGENMTEKQKDAYDSAKIVQRYLLNNNKKNKIKTYEQRLISSISLRDYEKVKEILLHLSSYTQVKMEFLLDIFENFEKNKNLVYTFINTLGIKEAVSNNTNKGEDE